MRFRSIVPVATLILLASACATESMDAATIDVEANSLAMAGHSAEVTSASESAHGDNAPRSSEEQSDATPATPPVTEGSTSDATEVHCNSFTSVWVFDVFYKHVPSVGSGSYNFNCVLARGDINVGVLALQESLNACYGQALVTDSDFGGNTEQAVRHAQTETNQAYEPDVLSVDGRFGPKTRSYFWFQLYDHSHGGAHTGWCGVPER